MGKSKCRKLKARRDRPTGVPSIKEFEESIELTDQDCSLSTVQFIIEKLQSPIVGNKECAACTIANVADKPELVSSLLENNVIKIAAPLLTDPSPAIRHAIAGALRNFSTGGGHEVSKAMVEQDVMTPLVALLKEYDCSWAPVKLQENSKTDSKSAIFLEACNLLWNLCESSNTALSIFNESNIISILIHCLNVDSFGLDIALAVAQCLHTVAEDNPEAIHKLLKSSSVEYLNSLISLELVEPPYILLRNLASGIVFNVYYGKISNCPTSTTTSLLEVITHTLKIPVTPHLEGLSKEILSYKEERKNKYRDEDSLKKKAEAVNNAVENLEYILTAKQVALEVMTNICSGEDTGDDWDECGSSDTSDEMVMDVGEESFTDFKSPLSIPCEVHGVVVSQQLVEKVLDQIIIPSEEIVQKLQEIPEGKDCLKRLHTLRCRALLCANNIIQGLNLEDLGGPSKLFDMWMNLANLIFKQTDSQDTEQLEAATSSLRAVLQKMAEENCSSHFQQMTESDLSMLTDICQQCQDGSVKVNIIRAIATLGCLLGNSESPNALKLISNIGTFFIDICVKNSELWVIAESLDAIFDVFAEDHLDPIVQEISLIEKLNNLLPLLKGKIKQQRKALGQHFPVITIAKTNLIRFIKYKSGQSRNNH